MSELWKDPIVEEVREARRKLMEECGNDLTQLSKRLSEDQKRHGDKLVRRKPVPLARRRTGT